MTRSLGSRFTTAIRRTVPPSAADAPAPEQLPVLPRQRSVGLDDLLAEGTALLDVHRSARRG